MAGTGRDGADASDAVEVLELVKLLLTTQHATQGSSSATAFNLDGVDAAAETIAAALEEDEIADAVEDILNALAVYIEFLDESGRWSGTDADYEELQSFLSAPSGSEDSLSGRPIIVPALSDEEQDKAFNAMPLIQQASSLLEWIGDGKDVTATGALRMKDIEAAAAADVPFLADIWASLVRAGLLTLGSTRTVVGPQIVSWNSTEARERVRIRRLLTLFQLLASIGYTTDPPHAEHLDPFLLIILARGTDDNPLTVAQLDEMAAEVDDAQWSDVALRVKNKLAALAELGIVEADTSYRVAAVAIQCVASALRVIEGEELLSDGDEDFDLDGNVADYDDGDTPANVIPLHDTGSGPEHR